MGVGIDPNGQNVKIMESWIDPNGQNVDVMGSWIDPNGQNVEIMGSWIDPNGQNVDVMVIWIMFGRRNDGLIHRPPDGRFPKKMAVGDSNDHLPPTYSSHYTRTTATLATQLMLQ